MDEQLRQQYLEAMGIQNWIPKGAVVSELVGAEDQTVICELYQANTRSISDAGDSGAGLLVIGEVPVADEDRQGVPFTGSTGQMLNAMLQAIGLQLQQVSQYERFARSSVELLEPKVILAVGQVAAQYLLQSGEALEDLRGCEHRFGSGETQLIVTYHPAYLLRSPEHKGGAWQDLQRVVRILRVS